MKRVSLLSLLVLLVSLPAAAQTPAPLITSVRPAAGPTSGGTLVVITGTNLGLPPNFSCILPCPAMVRFGSAEVPAIEESNTSLTVRTGDNRTTTAPGAFTYITDREAGYTTARIFWILDFGLNGQIQNPKSKIQNIRAGATPIFADGYFPSALAISLMAASRPFSFAIF